MDAQKRKKLEAKGWKVGTAQEFLGLTDEEALLVETKLAIATAFANLRRERGSQKEVAKLLGSSQSRVAKMEAGDRSVSLDLLTRGFFALGATRADLARVLKPQPRRRTQSKKKKVVAKKRRKKAELV